MLGGLLLLLLLRERSSAHPVRRHRRHRWRLLRLLHREASRLRHEHALPERVEPRRLRLQERLLLLLLRGLAKLGLLGWWEATAERCEPGRLRLKTHWDLLLLAERGWLLTKLLRLLKPGLLLLHTGSERVERRLLLKVRRRGTANRHIGRISRRSMDEGGDAAEGTNLFVCGLNMVGWFSSMLEKKSTSA